MLEIEKLICKNQLFHKDCHWIHAKLRYPDGQFLLVKQRLIYEVKKTHTAYRITHWKFGVLTTIKYGHDGQLFIQDNSVSLRAFALF